MGNRRIAPINPEAAQNRDNGEDNSKGLRAHPFMCSVVVLPCTSTLSTLVFPFTFPSNLFGLNLFSYVFLIVRVGRINTAYGRYMSTETLENLLDKLEHSG